MANAFRNLGVAESVLARAMGTPRHVAVVATLALAALGWVYLATMTAAAGVAGTFADLGVGMALFDRLFAPLGLDRLMFPLTASAGWLAMLAAVCMVDPAGWSASDAALHFAMWLAMSLAMMLPSAAAGRRVPSTFILGTGYLAVWIAFAMAVTALHWLMESAGLVGSLTAPVGAGLAAALLAVAGLYQFTGLKAACLVKCANPFAFLFANWTERTSGVFRLGVRQGLYCVGCCWALMLTMFAAGVMNLLWIALVAAVVTSEKLVARVWLTRAIGIGCLAGAALFTAYGAA